MALYWPEQGVALEIVDDPRAEPFDRTAHPGVRVIQTTCDELADFDRCNRVMTRVARELGATPPPSTPELLARRRALHERLMAETPRYW